VLRNDRREDGSCGSGVASSAKLDTTPAFAAGSAVVGRLYAVFSWYIFCIAVVSTSWFRRRVFDTKPPFWWVRTSLPAAALTVVLADRVDRAEFVDLTLRASSSACPYAVDCCAASSMAIMASSGLGAWWDCS
jgi:hypothetical protein